MVIPSFAPGEIRYLYLHWTGGDYRTVYPAYHFCVASDDTGTPIVVATHDVRANMRDVRASGAPYAAHTAGRNSYALGLGVCGMLGAEPADFGPYPLRENLLDACCRLAANACTAYGISVEPGFVMTHAEAAVEDGYFGCGDDERWDIARLAADTAPLEPGDARRTGDLLRARIVRFASELA